MWNIREQTIKSVITSGQLLSWKTKYRFSLPLPPSLSATSSIHIPSPFDLSASNKFAKFAYAHVIRIVTIVAWGGPLNHNRSHLFWNKISLTLDFLFSEFETKRRSDEKKVQRFIAFMFRTFYLWRSFGFILVKKRFRKSLILVLNITISSQLTYALHSWHKMILSR